MSLSGEHKHISTALHIVQLRPNKAITHHRSFICLFKKNYRNVSLDTEIIAWPLWAQGFCVWTLISRCLLSLERVLRRSAMRTLTPPTLDVLRWKEPVAVRHSGAAADEWRKALEFLQRDLPCTVCPRQGRHACPRSGERMQLWGKHTFLLLSGWKTCLLGADCQGELHVDLLDPSREFDRGWCDTGDVQNCL